MIDLLSSPPSLRHVEGDLVTSIYQDKEIEDTVGLYMNESAILKAPNASALVRKLQNGKLRVIQGQSAFGLTGRNAEQRIALEFLLDDSVPIVSLGGLAGTGKSLLALAAGIDAVIEQGKYKRVAVFRPLHAVGGEDLGFLPGDFDEKMDPWAQAVWDAVEAFCDKNVRDYIAERQALQVMPLTHLRGRTLSDTYIIVDEAQNLSISTLVTALTRVGENSKIVLTHDVNQRDNAAVGKADGVLAVVERLLGKKLFAHVALNKVERSAVAKLVSELFQDL